jgi:hypothetical protein
MRQELNKLVGDRGEAQAKLAEWGVADGDALGLLDRAAAEPQRQQFARLPLDVTPRFLAYAQFGDGEYRIWTEL